MVPNRDQIDRGAALFDLKGIDDLANVLDGDPRCRQRQQRANTVAHQRENQVVGSKLLGQRQNAAAALGAAFIWDRMGAKGHVDTLEFVGCLMLVDQFAAGETVSQDLLKRQRRTRDAFARTDDKDAFDGA